MEKKSTEGLLRIWKENDREQWSEEAFEAIKQLLLERGEMLPDQKEELKEKTEQTENSTDEPKGLGGWLILPALGLLFFPIGFLISLYRYLLPIFQEGYWQILTTPGSEAYHPLWGTAIILETVSVSMFVIFDLFLVYLFF